MAGLREVRSVVYCDAKQVSWMTGSHGRGMAVVQFVDHQFENRRIAADRVFLAELPPDQPVLLARR